MVHCAPFDESCDSRSGRGRSTDLAAIVTAHPGIDYSAVVATAPLTTIDFRGVTREIDAPNLIRL